jgi:hypothetical protein
MAYQTGRLGFARARRCVNATMISLGRLEPRGVIGIHVRKHYKTVPIDDVRGRQRQHPTVGSPFRAVRVAKGKISGLELRRHGEGDAITGRNPASWIPQCREP